jgi:hypothetical protein
MENKVGDKMIAKKNHYMTVPKGVLSLIQGKKYTIESILDTIDKKDRVIFFKTECSDLQGWLESELTDFFKPVR